MTAIITDTFRGSEIIQEELPYANFIATTQDNAVFTPTISNEIVSGYFYLTCHPRESENISWVNSLLNITTQAAVATTDFQMIVSLYGIPSNGYPQLIGEHIKSSISTGSVTENIYFDLKDSQVIPPLKKTNSATSSGKIRVDFPFRLKNFESFTLNRGAINGWNKCKIATLYGSPSDNAINYTIRDVTISYDGDMNSDFSDIRFAIFDSSTQLFTELCHNCISYTTSTTAKFDIFFPSILKNSTTKIFMFYGNSTATDSSVTTFYELYDALDSLTGWTKVRGADWTDGGDYVYNTSAGAVNTMKKTYSASGDKSYRFRLRANNTGASPWAGIQINSPNTDYSSYDQGYLILFYTDGSGIYNGYKIFEVAGGTPTEVASGAYTFTTGAWYDIEIQSRDEAGFNVLINNTLVSWYLDTTYTTGSVIRLFHTNSSGVRHDFDQLMVTNWVNNEPSLGSFGSEESITPINPDTPNLESTYATFTLPGDFTTEKPVHVKAKEYNTTEYESPDCIASPTNVLQLGYDGVDYYSALRFKIETICSDNCDVTVNYAKFTSQPRS